MRLRGTAAFAIVAALAFAVGLGSNALAKRGHGARPERTPVPTPTPRLVVFGEGATLPLGEPGDLHGLAGFVSSVVRGGVRVGYCPLAGERATSDLFGPAQPANACATDAGRVDFAVSDVPLRASQDVALGARGELVQIPYVVHSVAIVYDNPDVRGRLRLSLDSLCRIASGGISDWNRLPIDPANPAGLRYPHRPLRFVYRTDPNGETFSLANFLSSRDPSGAPLACRRAGQSFALGTVFDPRNTSVAPAPRFGVLPIPLPPGASSASFLGAEGAAGEIACVRADPGACRGARRLVGRAGGAGSIGYAGIADAATSAARGPGFGIATLYVIHDGIPHDYDPISDLPGATTTLETYADDRVLAPFVVDGRPARELIPADAPPAGPRCIAAIAPGAYAFPPVGYPIVGVTNLAFASMGNGDRTAALRVLAAVTNESKNFTTKRIRSIDGNGASTGTTGYSVLPLSTKKRGVPELVRCIRP